MCEWEMGGSLSSPLISKHAAGRTNTHTRFPLSPPLSLDPHHPLWHEVAPLNEQVGGEAVDEEVHGVGVVAAEVARELLDHVVEKVIAPEWGKEE